jgi:hypothetical protein
MPPKTNTMKKYLLIPALLLAAGSAFTQPKQKAKQADKAPTQKEMDDMMKEMQKAMEEISPED